MDLMKINLRGEIYSERYSSSIAFFLDRSKAFFDRSMRSVSSDNEFIILNFQVYRLFFYSTERKKNEYFLIGFIDVIRDFWSFLVLLHEDSVGVKLESHYFRDGFFLAFWISNVMKRDFSLIGSISF